MSKYIDVEVKLNKTIKVDCDNLKEAIRQAEDDFAELELTSEWLDARDVSFKENRFIPESANTLADLYYKDFDNNKLKEFINNFFDSSIRDIIYEETLNILSNKYNLDIKKIDI